MPHENYLVDSHCHLDFPEILDNLEPVLDRASKAGVGKIVTICTRPSRRDKTIALVERYPQIYFALGIHPHYAAEEPRISLDHFQQLTRHNKMVGIGETGLDYHYTTETKPAQIKSFMDHIQAAQMTGLPLIVHARNADDDMMNLLTSEYRNAPFSCVMHCYSSGEDLARVCLDLGFYLSFSGILTFKNAAKLKDLFKTVPADRILVETDAPYLAPEPVRGTRNEPSYVKYTADCAAKLLGMERDPFMRLTTSNFHHLFGRAL